MICIQLPFANVESFAALKLRKTTGAAAADAPEYAVVRISIFSAYFIARTPSTRAIKAVIVYFTVSKSEAHILNHALHGFKQQALQLIGCACPFNIIDIQFKCELTEPVSMVYCELKKAGKIKEEENMKIAIGSDHGGFHLKEHIKQCLQSKGFVELRIIIFMFLVCFLK